MGRINLLWERIPRTSTETACAEGTPSPDISGEFISASKQRKLKGSTGLEKMAPPFLCELTGSLHSWWRSCCEPGRQQRGLQLEDLSGEPNYSCDSNSMCTRREKDATKLSQGSRFNFDTSTDF